MFDSVGKRIVQLQASLALVQSPSTAANAAAPDAHGRVPFTHPALDGLNNLSQGMKDFLISKTQMAELAQKYELQKVLRWSPRKVSFPFHPGERECYLPRVGLPG